MSNSNILGELIALRDEWQANADHLTKTIELVKAKQSPESTNKPSWKKDMPLSIVHGETVNTGIGQPVGRTTPIPKFSSLSVDAKIIAIIRRENRFVSRDEIEVIAKEIGRPFKNSIATSLSGIKRKGKEGLVLYKIGHNDVVWGFQEWFDDNGEIRPDFMYYRPAVAK